MYDVVTIGAATCDIFVTSDSIKVADDNLVLPYSSKAEITSSLISSGGGATNSAVSFARLGLKTSVISEVFNDPLSVYVIRDLQNEKVDTTLLHHNDQLQTDFSVILVCADGGRTILTNRGDSRLESNKINWDKLVDTGWVYISSLEGNLDLLELIIGFCQDHHIKISLNPGNRELAQPSRLVSILPYVDFLLLNRFEASTLTGIVPDDDRIWEKLLSYKSQLVAVTNGREGAHVLTTDGQKYFSPIINTRPLDETGAGDSFGSAFVAGLINHLDPPQCLSWAIKNSASVVSYLGAKTGLLTISQIK